MSARIGGAVFVGAIFALALLVYLAVLQWRKIRYRKLAADLGATFCDQGFAATGEISGISDGRKYTVRTKAGGRSGMWTVISADCANRGAGFTIDGAFFKKFPDWRFALMQGGGLNAVPGVTVALLGLGSPVRDNYKEPILELLRESSLQRGEVLKRGKLRIEKTAISFTRHGVIANAEIVRQTVAAISEIAGRIESQPVA
jgi:hypothetical protein